MSEVRFISHMKHLRAIRSAMGEETVSLPLGTVAGLRELLRLGGVNGLRQLLGPAPFDLRPYVERNLARRRIRFQAIFGNPPVARLYLTVLLARARLSVALLMAAFNRHSEAGALVYNGFLMPDSLTAAVATHLGRAKLVVEKGFFPLTLQCDTRGINFDSTLPRDPAFYRELSGHLPSALPGDIGRRRTKLKGDQISALPASYIFVPMQVPSDMQVLDHSPWISDMRALYGVVARLADRMPDLHFVLKEHPSFPLSIRSQVTAHPRILFANRNDTRELIEAASAVITINSTAGLESLFLGKTVVTLGNAPYNIEGLVQHANSEDELFDIMRELPSWEPDEVLRSALLRYVNNVFLVHGDMNDPSPDLLDGLRRRFERTDEHSRLVQASKRPGET